MSLPTGNLQHAPAPTRNLRRKTGVPLRDRPPRPNAGLPAWQQLDARISVFWVPNRWAEQVVREVKKSDIEGGGRSRQILTVEPFALVLGAAEVRLAFR